MGSEMCIRDSHAGAAAGAAGFAAGGGAGAALAAPPAHAAAHGGAHGGAGHQFDPLFIEDPLAPGNNVGRNCFRIGLILRTWGDALAALTAALDLDEQGDESTAPLGLLSYMVSLREEGEHGVA